MHKTPRDLWTMKRNPIDWSCVANGLLVDTSALRLTNKQKYDIEDNNETIQSKTILKRNIRRTSNTL